MKLWNGVEIPEIGFGPAGMGYTPNSYGKKSGNAKSIWGRLLNKAIYRPYDKHFRASRAKKEYIAAIASAVNNGFRLIDYSMAYGSGWHIAKAIKQSEKTRDDVFLTGRVSNVAQFRGRIGVRDEIEKMLENYQTDHVDLLMFHWPVTDCYEETWKEICRAYDEGNARSIGVANCHKHHLERLMKCGLKPMVNQFEVHPLFTQKELVRYNQEHDIVVEAYTAIARCDDRLMRLPALKKIAANHNKTLAQVVLRWHIQNNCVPVVRSLNKDRQRENLEVFDFSLTSEEMKIIDGFNIDARLRYHPDNCDFTIL